LILQQISKRLDDFFDVREFPPDQPFSSLVPEVHIKAGIDIWSYLTPSFSKAFNGLMVNNTKEVHKIVGMVFLGDECLDQLLDRGDRNVLLVSHHPIFMETSNRGFLPISLKYWKEMKARRISAYVLHNPLDVHHQISTGRAWARALQLEQVTPYHSFLTGCAGVWGRLPEKASFEELLSQVSCISGVADCHFVKHRPQVCQIGVVAGGIGTDAILDTIDQGCDSLLTGTYYNQVQNDIGRQYREEFNALRQSLDINLIECSHYASEKLVILDLLEFCAAEFGLPTDFISQKDPWL
jgi:putative NIF3 family GTP cyclohydrolase 1 type 2